MLIYLFFAALRTIGSCRGQYVNSRRESLAQYCNPKRFLVMPPGNRPFMSFVEPDVFHAPIPLKMLLNMRVSPLTCACRHVPSRL